MAEASTTVGDGTGASEDGSGGQIERALASKLESPVDEFGDDFDEFAEEQAVGTGTFGELTAPSIGAAEPDPQSTQHSHPLLLDFPHLDLDYGSINSDAVFIATQSVLSHIIPKHRSTGDLSRGPPFYSTELPALGPTPFQSARSASLWEQLSGPPIVQPFNWTRSHIRRLFLISLGVPVDLDEILPKAPQKKLVLPHARLGPPELQYEVVAGHEGVPETRNLIDGAQDPGLLAPSEGGAIPVTSSSHSPALSSAVPTPLTAASSASRTRRRRGPPPPPDLDESDVRALCHTELETLRAMHSQDMIRHSEKVVKAREGAGSMLEYWNMRKVEASIEKEALEGVVENLVKHARSTRLVKARGKTRKKQN